MENAVCEKELSVNDVLSKIWSKLRIDAYLDPAHGDDYDSPADTAYKGEVIIDDVAEAMVEAGFFPDFASVPYGSDGLAARVAEAVYKRLRAVEFNRKTATALQQKTCDLLNGTDLGL